MELVQYIFVVCSICLLEIDALMFHLSPNQKKCLQEEIHKDVLVTGEYEISDGPGQTATLKVRMQITCHQLNCPKNVYTPLLIRQLKLLTVKTCW